jgi:hypothetical protein
MNVTLYVHEFKFLKIAKMREFQKTRNIKKSKIRLLNFCIETTSYASKHSMCTRSHASKHLMFTRFCTSKPWMILTSLPFTYTYMYTHADSLSHVTFSHEYGLSRIFQAIPQTKTFLKTHSQPKLFPNFFSSICL